VDGLVSAFSIAECPLGDPEEWRPRDALPGPLVPVERQLYRFIGVRVLTAMSWGVVEATGVLVKNQARLLV